MHEKPGPATHQTAALSFFERVYQVVRLIPRGQVATYGQIAGIVSHRGAARTVGWALHGLAEGSDVPWHRVINARGQISLDPGTQQRTLLQQEGIAVNEQGKIELKQYQWPGLDWPDVEALHRTWRANTPSQQAQLPHKRTTHR
jgi:methylated-DNA-protein-cysteine methyltransferase-like protein